MARKLRYDPNSGRGYHAVKTTGKHDNSDAAFKAGIAKRKHAEDRKAAKEQEILDELSWKKYLEEVRRLDALEWAEDN